MIFFFQVLEEIFEFFRYYATSILIYLLFFSGRKTPGCFCYIAPEVTETGSPDHSRDQKVHGRLEGILDDRELKC